MIRKIIEINKEKCNGCGACAAACHEGAIEMVNGKAKLTRDDYCDGFGDCLPNCPTGAITFTHREAAAYDEAAVKENMKKKNSLQATLEQKEEAHPLSGSQLGQWPCQIKLVPIHAPYFHNANLLIAADCTAYAYANFHQEFMKGKITLIGCPKLDSVNYSEKLTQIIAENDIKSVTVLRMEVPCCGGLEKATITALENSGKFISCQVATITIDGKIKY